MSKKSQLTKYSVIFTLIILLAFFCFVSFAPLNQAQASSVDIYEAWHLSSDNGLNVKEIWNKIKQKNGVDVTAGGRSDIIVAVIDSGLDMTNPFFNYSDLWRNPNQTEVQDGTDNDGNGVVDDLYGAGFVGFSTSSNVNNVGNGDFADCVVGGNNAAYYHGTHVAGIIHSIAPNAKILPIRAGIQTGSTCSFEAIDVIAAIRYAVNVGADIINLSLGSTSASFSTSQQTFKFNGVKITSSIQDAINFATENGCLVVAASGNNGKNEKFYPAYNDNVISVMASNNDGNLWSNSNYGSAYDVVAPGEYIVSTIGSTQKANGGMTPTSINLLPDGYGIKNGTSMASPYVCGVAALLMCYMRAVKGTEVASYLTDETCLSNITINSLGEKSKLLNNQAVLNMLTKFDTISPTDDNGDIVRMAKFDNEKVVLTYNSDKEPRWFNNGILVNIGPSYTFVPYTDSVIEVVIDGVVQKTYYVTSKSYNKFLATIIGSVVGSVVGTLLIIAIILHIVIENKKKKAKRLD